MQTQEYLETSLYQEPEPSGGFPTLNEIIGLALLALSLYAAFNIIESARWIKNLSPLIIPIVLALVLGHYLARRKHPRRVGYLVVIATGVLLTLALGLSRLSGGAPIILGLFVLAIAWFTAHATLWLAYRGPSPALIVLPGLLVLLISLSFLTSDYFLRLPLFLLASAPAVAHFHLQRWGGRRQNLAPRLAPLVAGLALMGGAVAFSWPAPTPDEAIRPAATNKLEEPLYAFWENTADFFEKIPNRKEWPQFNLHPILPFTGPVAQSDDVIMRVTATEPRKWRLRVYESYSRVGWTRVPKAPRTDFTSEYIGTKPDSLREREEVKIKVRLLSTNTHIASAGIPLRSSISSFLESSPIPAFSLDLTDEQDTYLPPDIWDFRNGLVEEQGSDLDITELEDDLSSLGLKLLEPPSDADQPLEGSLTVERIDSSERPSTALLFPKRQGPPRSYTTVGSVSTANPLVLREASRTTGTSVGEGLKYPTWVTDRYLQLPPDFSQPVKDLALELAKGHDSTYDVAMSIQNYLHTLPYSTDVVPPPPGVDPVEWFITVQRVGFCNYFASAMITMLRSLDIPARLVVGFAPGDWDSQRKAWVVRAKHYHAWPEVYFPEYGWVEFEPTPAGVQPSLENLGFQRQDTPPFDPSILEECFGAEFECEEELEPGLDQDDIFLSDLDKNLDEVLADVGGDSGGTSGFFIWLGSLLGLAVAAILGTNLYLRYLTARLGAPAVVYSSMSLLARLGGIARQSHYTPAEYGSRLAYHLPGHSGSIGQVVNGYEVSRYSRNKILDTSQTATLRRSWKSLRWALLRLIFRRLDPRRLFRGY